MKKLSDILGDYQVFLATILQEVQEAGFQISDFTQLDHLCYRTISLKNYETKKQELAELATLLTETSVNHRPIATFRLHQPILYQQWRIDCVELPAPKESSNYSEGLEHIEFVLYDPIPVFLQKYSQIQFNLRSAERGINPEVSYQLPTYTVKFHLLSLQTVTYLEKKLAISEVSDSQ